MGAELAARRSPQVVSLSALRQQAGCPPSRQNGGDERALERGGRDRRFVKDVTHAIQRRVVEAVQVGNQTRRQRKVESLHESSDDEVAVMLTASGNAIGSAGARAAS